MSTKPNIADTRASVAMHRRPYLFCLYILLRTRETVTFHSTKQAGTTRIKTLIAAVASFRGLGGGLRTPQGL